MLTRTYTIRFNTPAFLGNAEQRGQWRTPSFKHLLREWWRVAWAAENGYPDDPHGNAMRIEENNLFGTAADGEGKRSKIRIRLNHWDIGGLRKWEIDPKVLHPEVGKEGKKIGAHLYLGYGPLKYEKKHGTALKENAAIQVNEVSELKIAFPDNSQAIVEQALSLINSFASIGGRSRNGWGSLQLCEAINNSDLPLREWKNCLDRDWPHAIGCDQNGTPTIWQTERYENWQLLMKCLAEIKIGLRTQQFPFHTGKHTAHPEARHWLCYPITNHNVIPWGQGRLPNTLRIKVREDNNGNLYGVIFHMPCLPPEQFNPNLQEIAAVWHSVHQYLDGRQDLKRSAQ